MGGLFFEAVEILPESLVLLDLLFLGKGQFHAKDEVREGVFVEDVVAKEGLVADFEVNPEVADTQAVELGARAVDGADKRPVRFDAIGGDGTDGFDEGHLLDHGKLVDLGHALAAEVNLIHATVIGEPRRTGYRGRKVKAILPGRATVPFPPRPGDDATGSGKNSPPEFFLGYP
jgi:hypothetical protein